MADVKHIIEPENQGTWIAVTFIIALLSLLIGLVSLNRIQQTTYFTQAEILLLKKQIDGQKGAAAAAPEAPAAAPEQPAP